MKRTIARAAFGLARPSLRARSARASIAIAVAAVALAACSSGILKPGEWATLRYFGEVQGTTPLRLYPPMTDKNGDAFVMYGAPDRPEVEIYVGPKEGGWSHNCTTFKGEERGAHGWVGKIENTVWYWAGDALVGVGSDGGCGAVLDRDPYSEADLLMTAVFPYVDERPSHVYIPAWIRAVSDPRPWSVKIDTTIGRYVGTPTEFTPNDAQNVVVAGVGANPSAHEGFAIVQYNEGTGTATHLEGRFVDANAVTTSTVDIPVLPSVTMDQIQGYLQGDAGDHVVGLLPNGILVQFDRTRAQVTTISSFNAVGVHLAGGKLWVVGTLGNHPVVARIMDDWSVADPQVWTASEEAATALSGSVNVRDDRTSTTTTVDWSDPMTAIGPFPFVSPNPPDRYSTGSTSWLVAGPYYSTGVEGETSVAFSPVGISYP